MSQQRGLRILIAFDGSVYSEAAVKLTAGITWPAGTIAHVLAVVPERWLLSHLSCKAKRMLVETMDVVRQADYAAAARLAMRISDGLPTHGLSVDDDAALQMPSAWKRDTMLIQTSGRCARIARQAHLPEKD